MGRFPSLVLDNKGNPAISYYERVNPVKGYFKLARWDGNSWNIQRIDTLERVFLGFFGARKNSSLVLDENDNPIVAYSDQKLVKLAWWDGSQWVLETVVTAGESRLGQQVSLGLDNSGVLHLAFADVASRSGPGIRGAVKYARGTPTTAPSASPAPEANPIPSSESNLTRGPTVVDLDAVPMVDLSKHSVPVEDVVFDTFDSSFVRLSDASERLMRLLKDAIKPIYNPGYGDSMGLSWLGDGDLVIGYATNGSAYAYPIKVLNSHEMVNVVIDGVPILISYCPLCGSGIVYTREVEGQTRLFGNTSALYQSDLVMYDHQTGSYWFQVLGEAIVGNMTGNRLKLLASMTVTWGEWKCLYPDTRLLVSDGGKAFGSSYAFDPLSASYSERLDAGRFLFPVSEAKLDNRLRASEVVITAEVNSAARAYPLRRIGDDAVNDRVGGVPVVIFSRGVTGSAFLATVSGQQLTFDFKGGAFVDRETGSTWNAVGRAVAGALEGASLESIPSRRAFWFSIVGAIPGLELYAS